MTHHSLHPQIFIYFIQKLIKILSMPQIGIPLNTLQPISQEPENQPQNTTSAQLLSVSYQLYCLHNYNRFCIDSINAKNVFERISAKINKNNVLVNELVLWHREDNIKDHTEKKIQQFNAFLRNGNKIENNRYLSKSEMIERINKRDSQIKETSGLNIDQVVFQTDNKPIVSINNCTQTMPLADFSDSKTRKQESESTVPDLLAKLDDFDEQRSRIKQLVYMNSTNVQQELYKQWGILHLSMKQILQKLMQKLSVQKSSKQIYEQFFHGSNNLLQTEENVSKSQSHRQIQKSIDGISQQQAMQKLNQYLKSLYLDERQLTIYNANIKKIEQVNEKNQEIIVGRVRKISQQIQRNSQRYDVVSSLSEQGYKNYSVKDRNKHRFKSQVNSGLKMNSNKEGSSSN